MTESYAYGIWAMVAVNAAIFIFFVLSFLRPKGSWEWRSMGTFGAFVVALFTEMYGFPLTVYLLTSVLGSSYPVIAPFSHTNGHLWVALSGGSVVVWAFVMVLSSVVILGGLAVMGAGWRQIHRARGELVTSGLYGFVRHPQYTGLFLITVGFMLQWPTIITLVLWPILMLMYYRLARREEGETAQRFAGHYESYMKQVPMFLPRLALRQRRAEA